MDILKLFLILFLVWVVYQIIISYSYSSSDIFIDNRLYIDKSSLHEAGYGVFTRGFIPKNTIIEVAHTIRLPVNEREHLTTLLQYDFQCPDPNYTLIAMGFGGIYNNHKNYNVDWVPSNDTVKYTTNKNVYPGEELFVYYGDNYFNSHGLNETY